MKKDKKYITNIIITTVLLLLIILWACTRGTANIDIMDSLNILLSKIPIVGKSIDISNISTTAQKIVLNVRMPRIIMALFAGMGLAVAGTVFQGVFKNPMADPYILGVSSGAALGVTVAMVLSLNTLILGLGMNVVMAFVFSILTVVIVFRIASIGNKVPTTTLLLTGLAINYFLSSIMTLIMLLNKDYIEKIYLWTLGSFSTSSWKQIYIVFPVVIICSIFIFVYSKELNLLLLGETDALSLGVNTSKVKKILLGVSSIMLSVIVSTTGVIGFVGLIIPHITRFLVGPDHRRLIPQSAINGAIFMIFCDTLARSIMPPREISVGVITSLFGVPFFIYLLYQNKRRVF